MPHSNFDHLQSYGYSWTLLRAVHDTFNDCEMIHLCVLVLTCQVLILTIDLVEYYWISVD